MDPTTFLDKICSSVTGVIKGYIMDTQSNILAESSLRIEDPDVLRVVRAFPSQYRKLQSKKLISLTTATDKYTYMNLVVSPLLITFVCEENANLSLLSQLPGEMTEFVSHLQAYQSE